MSLVPQKFRLPAVKGCLVLAGIETFCLANGYSGF